VTRSVMSISWVRFRVLAGERDRCTSVGPSASAMTSDAFMVRPYQTWALCDRISEATSAAARCLRGTCATIPEARSGDSEWVRSGTSNAL
jgi:hypothetical protein